MLNVWLRALLSINSVPDVSAHRSETSGTESAWQQTRKKYQDRVQTFNCEYLWCCLACFLNIKYSNLTLVMAISKLRPVEVEGMALRHKSGLPIAEGISGGTQSRRDLAEVSWIVLATL